jgi:hypothetical protein
MAKATCWLSRFPVPGTVIPAFGSHRFPRRYGSLVEASTHEIASLRHLQTRSNPANHLQTPASTERRQGRRTPDKEEVPGSSPGSPTREVPAHRHFRTAKWPATGSSTGAVGAFWVQVRPLLSNGARGPPPGAPPRRGRPLAGEAANSPRGSYTLAAQSGAADVLGVECPC